MWNFLYELISTPFGYVMRFIYTFVGSYGLSIILFSLLIKLLSLPLTMKQKKSMLKMQRIQPQVARIQKQYGKDRQRMQQELQMLYDKEDVSPTGGCGTTLLMFPLLIGVYGVVSQPLTYFMQLSADEISAIATRLNYTMGANAYTNQIGLAGQIFQNFDKVSDISDKLMQVNFNFGFLDLSMTPNFKDPSLLWLIPILSCLTAFAMAFVQQWIQKRNTPVTKNSTGGAMEQSNKMMLFMMPLMSLWFGFILPCGLGVYWIANNVFSGLQEYLLQKFMVEKKQKPEEGDC